MLGPTASGGLYAKPEILEEMDPMFGGGEMITIEKTDVIARHQGHAHLLRDATGGHLVAHGAQGGGGRPDEDETGRGAGLGKARVLREEAVAGMHGLRAGGPRGRDDLVLVQIALGGGSGAEGHRQVGLEHVERFTVGIGEDGDGGDPHLAAGPDDPPCDLATIGDQDFLEGGRHGAGMIAGLLRRGNARPRYFEGWASTSRSRAFTAGAFQSRAPTIRARSRPSRSMRYAVGGPKTP